MSKEEEWDQVATWSWWWVTSPLWISALFALAVLVVVGIVAIIYK